ncbi:MAG: hypothetical protein ABL974_18245, partial [Prosthecobacter sp.]
MRSRHLFSAMLLLPATLMALSSCTSANRMLKARPPALSPFFEQPQLAQDTSKQLPFQKIWTTPDRRVIVAGLAKRKLFIAPVTLQYLRPVNKQLATLEISRGGVPRQEQDVARRLRDEFAAAFRRSPKALYQIVGKPGTDT